MTLTDVLVVRLRIDTSRSGRATDEASTRGHAMRIEAQIQHLVTALVERRYRRAVLDRPVLAERWPLHDGPTTVPWPIEVSVLDVVRALERTRDVDARAVAASLRAQTIQPAGPHPVQPSRPADASEESHALTPWDPLACAIVLLAEQQVREDARRRLIPVPATQSARAAFTVVSQGPDGPWAETTRRGAVIELVWRGTPRPYQLAFDPKPKPLDAALIPGILAELHAEGLRDYLVLHRMAAEHGRSGAFNWSWREHRERTAYARRVARGNLTDEHAAEQVTERLWRLKGAEVRQTVRRPDGQEAWVRIGPFGLIDIPAAIQHGTSLERARIALNPALYEGAHKDAAQPHFALLPDEALTLEGPRLRLAVLVTLAMRYARDEHGVVVRSAAALWEDLTTHGGVPAQKRWPRAATVLQRALEQLTKLGVLGAWEHEPGAVTPATRYTLRPAAWWHDQLVHQVPPSLPPPPAARPRTGAELQAWRTKRGWTQAEAADQLGIHRRTILRAEATPDRSLGRAITEAFARYRPKPAGP